MRHSCWLDMNIMPGYSAATEDTPFLVSLHMMCKGALCIVYLARLLLRMYKAAKQEPYYGKDKVCGV